MSCFVPPRLHLLSDLQPPRYLSEQSLVYSFLNFVKTFLRGERVGDKVGGFEGTSFCKGTLKIQMAWMSVFTGFFCAQGSLCSQGGEPSSCHLGLHSHFYGTDLFGVRELAAGQSSVAIK